MEIEANAALPAFARTVLTGTDESPRIVTDGSVVGGVLPAALNDRARSLQVELTTRMTEETNRRLYIVSVITTLFMPATFITGFSGMNTGGLLWSGDEMPSDAPVAAEKTPPLSSSQSQLQLHKGLKG